MAQGDGAVEQGDGAAVPVWLQHPLMLCWA